MKLSKVVTIAAVAFGAWLGRPDPAAAQFASQQKFLGAHIGLSGVGSTVSYGLNGEFAYNDRIGIGAWLDTWSYGQTFGNQSDYSFRYFAIAGTGAYHFPVASQPKLDPFLGLALGYYVVNVSFEGAGFDGVDGSRIFLGGFGGVRYMLTETLAGVARLGFGASYLTIGLDLKM